MIIELSALCLTHISSGIPCLKAKNGIEIQGILTRLQISINILFMSVLPHLLIPNIKNDSIGAGGSRGISRI